MTNTLESIIDRTSWLAYRAAWRIAYAEASQDVRDVKRTMRQDVSLRREGGKESELARIDARMSSHQYDRQAARVVANHLMQSLKVAKMRRDALLVKRDEAKAEAA